MSEIKWKTRRLKHPISSFKKENTRRMRLKGGLLDKSFTGGANSTVSAKPEDFHLPRHIDEWFTDPKNRAMYFYGLLMILKDKEEEMKKKITSIKIEIEKLTSEYKNNEVNYLNLLENDVTEDTSEMKGDMQEKVREGLNIPYQSKYTELIQKKQAYDVVLISIQNRKWYIADVLERETEAKTKAEAEAKKRAQGASKPAAPPAAAQASPSAAPALAEAPAAAEAAPPSAAPAPPEAPVAATPEQPEYNDIISELKKTANAIYALYRGEKYRKIREKLFGHIKTIAQSHATYKNSFALNASITGPAGSGKTTLARKMGEWLSKLGILTYDAFYEDKKGKLALIETGRSGLIAEYTGQTAPKTLGVLVRSLERTLFIDEAYSAAGCAFDGDDKLVADSYGEEFLAELLRFMNDHKGFTSLIVAGYDNLMKKCFFARNEGLPRRFPDQISLPFYSTDELFGIFTSNVVSKSQAGIVVERNEIQRKIDSNSPTSKNSQLISAKNAIDKKLKNMEYARFNYLTVMKPSFLMVHFDTSYDGINTLRKYLTVMSLRESPVPKSSISKKIYSWTILSHVLINLLDDEDSVRKNLFRRIFYEEVFNFSNFNLSYFPAQAGEMENLADECSKKLAPKLSETNLFVTPDDEMTLLNDYCQGKKIKVYINYDISNSEMLSSNSGITKTKLENNMYIEEIRQLMDGLSKMPKEENQDESVALSTTSKGKQIKTSKQLIKERINLLKTKIVDTTTGSSEPQTKAINNIIQPEGEKHTSYELCLLNTKPKDMRRRIHDFFDLDSLFGTYIPDLHNLWSILLNGERDKLIKHMVNLYTKKVNYKYIEDILELSEREFPVHINKQALELEFEQFKNKIDNGEVPTESASSASSASSEPAPQVPESATTPSGPSPPPLTTYLNYSKNIKQDKLTKWSNFKDEFAKDLLSKNSIIAFKYSVDNYNHKDYSEYKITTLPDRKEDLKKNILYDDLGIGAVRYD